jgi:hypothetical protein
MEKTMYRSISLSRYRTICIGLSDYLRPIELSGYLPVSLPPPIASAPPSGRRRHHEADIEMAR